MPATSATADAATCPTSPHQDDARLSRHPSLHLSGVYPAVRCAISDGSVRALHWHASAGGIHTAADGVVLNEGHLDRLNNLAPAGGERHDGANMARIDR
jgi:hypothetical protein